MFNGRQDSLDEDFTRSPLSAPGGQRPGGGVQQRVWDNTRILALVLAVFIGIPSAIGPFLGRSVLLGVAGVLVGAGAAVAAVLGRRRRQWPLLLGALGVEVSFTAVLMLASR
jgi:hypothetical protein